MVCMILVTVDTLCTCDRVEFVFTHNIVIVVVVVVVIVVVVVSRY